MKIVKNIGKTLKKDALQVANGLYRMNANNCIGYLFNPTFDNKYVSTGMFCNFKDEINKDQWTYFYDFQDFYKI